MEKFKSKLVIVFCLLFALTITLGVMGWRKVVASPGPGQAEVFFAPVGISFPGSGTVHVRINSGSEGIGFARLEMTFDATKFQILTDPVVSGPLTNVVELSSSESANTQGRVVMVAGLPVENRLNPPTGDFEVLRFDLVPVDQSGWVSQLVISGLSQVVTMGATELEILGSDLTVSQVIEPSPTLVPTPTPTSTPSPTTTLSWESGNITTQLNQEFEAKIRLNSVEPISGVDAQLTFDSSQLEVMQVEDSGLFAGDFFSQIDNAGGSVRMSKVVQVGGSYSGEGEVFKVRIKAKAVGTSMMTWNFTPGSVSESNVISKNTGEDILTDPDDLQVVASDSKKLKVKIGTYGNPETTGTVKDDKTGKLENFSTDVTGSSGLMDWNDASATGESDLVVKVSTYLRRRKVVQLVSGENLVDYGKLVGGDLNDDGVINTIDLALLYATWFGSGPADLNTDGVANTADYWLLTGNFLAQDE